jgi:hypothetical protein
VAALVCASKRQPKCRELAAPLNLLGAPAVVSFAAHLRPSDSNLVSWFGMKSPQGSKDEKSWYSHRRTKRPSVRPDAAGRGNGPVTQWYSNCRYAFSTLARPAGLCSSCIVADMRSFELRWWGFQENKSALFACRHSIQIEKPS